MPAIQNNPITRDAQPEEHRNRWKSVVFIICGLVLLCGVACSILAAVGWINAFKPKTRALLYQNASIAHMFEICKPNLYNEWDVWMQANAGSDTVIAIFYSKTSPVPDGLYAYDLFVQVDPEQVVAGRELSFPEEGIKAFLIETRAPFIACSPDLKGTIKILSSTEVSLTARLDVNGVINKNNWIYNGELEFKQTPILK